MTTKKAIEQALEHLKNVRRDGDFEGQLTIYKELGSLWFRQNKFSEAADNLKKAARVAEYLDKSNETEAICHSLIAIYERAGDPVGVIDVYGLLHIHFNSKGDVARGNQYNDVRLDLVAQQIGKKNPSHAERFQYERKVASKVFGRELERFRRLLRGNDEPTVPDDHVSACYFLVRECLNEERYDDALQHVSNCEQAMRNQNAWVTPEGTENVRNIKELIEQKRQEGS